MNNAEGHCRLAAPTVLESTARLERCGSFAALRMSSLAAFRPKSPVQLGAFACSADTVIAAYTKHCSLPSFPTAPSAVVALRPRAVALRLSSHRLRSAGSPAATARGLARRPRASSPTSAEYTCIAPTFPRGNGSGETAARRDVAMHVHSYLRSRA